MPRRRHIARESVDFDDEDAVLAEMARELDVDPDELKIRDDRSGFSVQAYEITIRGGGHKEWKVVADEDAERTGSVRTRTTPTSRSSPRASPTMNSRTP
jgi:hypothetical protein